MKDSSFVDFVLDQLRGMRGVRACRMFGGNGLYQKETFFGIIADGRLYLKTDKRSREQYTNAGVKPFQPTPKQTLKRYFEVPVDVLEDDSELVRWAKEAVAVARKG
jgi:DNA transformation protein